MRFEGAGGSPEQRQQMSTEEERMNVVVNTDEANVVMSLVTALVIDQAGLTEAGKKAVRDWRRELAPGSVPLDAFTQRLNLAIGNFIDERTTRMMHTRGQVKVERRS